MILSMMRSNLTMALLACGRECDRALIMLPAEAPASLLRSKLRECGEACKACLDALESSRSEIRGLLIHAVRHACLSLMEVMKSHEHPNLKSCIESVCRCVEECELHIDDRDYGMFGQIGNNLCPPLNSAGMGLTASTI
jgi:hypothetical protein